MAKFRKKPVEIEATQFDGSNYQEIKDFSNNVAKRKIAYEGNELIETNFISVDTLEGCMTAVKGDWIIKGVKGEFYPCKPDIFEMTYEMVNENV